MASTCSLNYPLTTCYKMGIRGPPHNFENRLCDRRKVLGFHIESSAPRAKDKGIAPNKLIEKLLCDALEKELKGQVQVFCERVSTAEKVCGVFAIACGFPNIT